MPTALAMDRTRVCTYTFENSSKCRIPLTSHPYLCTFHARKDAENRATDDAVRDIAFHLSNRYVSHCDLSAAIAQTITAVAYNHIPVSHRRHHRLSNPKPSPNPGRRGKRIQRHLRYLRLAPNHRQQLQHPPPHNSAVQPGPRRIGRHRPPTRPHGRSRQRSRQQPHQRCRRHRSTNPRQLNRQARRRNLPPTAQRMKRRVS